MGKQIKTALVMTGLVALLSASSGCDYISKKFEEYNARKEAYWKQENERRAKEKAYFEELINVKVGVGKDIEVDLFGGSEYGGMPSPSTFSIVEVSSGSVRTYNYSTNSTTFEVHGQKFPVVKVTPEYIEIRRPRGQQTYDN